MKFLKIAVSCLLLLIKAASWGQAQRPVPLKIGDKIPDFVLKTLLNGSVQTSNASDLYKSGLLIINFWATWCVACVEEMPRLDSLEHKNENRFHMVFVTSQSDKIVSDFLGKHKGLQDLSFSAGDTLLKRYFPHNIVPHNIWIDKEGIVRAMTSDTQIDEKNVAAFFNGSTDLPTIQEDLNFNWQKPLKVADTEFVYRMIITPEKSIGNAGVLAADSNQEHTRALAWNRMRTDLFWLALMKAPMEERDWNFVEIHCKDSTQYFYPKFILNHKLSSPAEEQQLDEWSKKNQFCLDMSANKKLNIDRFYNLLLGQLSLYFNVRAEIKMKQTECWTIVRIPSTVNLLNSNHHQSRILQMIGNEMIADNQTLDEIAKKMNGFYPKEQPFVNHTGIAGRINLDHDFRDLSGGLTITRMKEYLNQIGLDLKLEQCLYPNLIIYDMN